MFSPVFHKSGRKIMLIYRCKIPLTLKEDMEEPSPSYLVIYVC